MYSNRNNLRSELTANVSTSATSISITSWEWILWETDTVACLEHIENNVITKREIVKITAKSTDTFTVTRWFATCIMNDNTKEQGNTKQTFSVGDFLTLYLSKELWNSITDNIWINETALQTMVGHIVAPETCINNCCLWWKQAIDTAYVSKYWWNAWFGDASDGDLTITTSDLDERWNYFLCADKEYNFNNLTICEWVTVKFEWNGVPTINVWDTFRNYGVVELKAPFVSNTSQLDHWLASGTTICNQKTDWWICCGWDGWKGEDWRDCGWNYKWCCWCPWTATCGWDGWQGGWYTGSCSCCAQPWTPAIWLDGGNGGRWWWFYAPWWWGGGWGGGWWWRYWNGWNGGNGWYTDQQTSWATWWNGGNSWLYGTWWKGWTWWCVYSAWWRWWAWKGWNWYYGWCGGDSTYEWYAWDGWCGVMVWWHGGNATSNRADWAWKGWNAITNVYWFHLNARNIINTCINHFIFEWSFCLFFEFLLI